MCGLFILVIYMRYHYKQPATYLAVHGKTYKCNHDIYSRCTLYSIGKRGLAVIQQRFDHSTKRTWWAEIDPWLIDDIYLQDGFMELFDNRAKECTDDGLYPTITVRQLMWALKMKPLPKMKWETCFDRRDI